jgi:hypothetical protein
MDSTGKITGATIYRALGWGIDDEAARLASILPKWNPGKINGVDKGALLLLMLRFSIDGTPEPVISVSHYACFKKEDLNYLRDTKSSGEYYNIKFKEIE